MANRRLDTRISAAQGIKKRQLKACRSCESDGIEAFIAPGRNVELAYCPACALVQAMGTVPPYAPWSTDCRHCESGHQEPLGESRINASEIIEDRVLGPESLVVEIASEDGRLLRNFTERNIAVLGIDPLETNVRAALRRGVNTTHGHFTRDLAAKLRKEGCIADVVIANNVLDRAIDAHDLLSGVREVLKDDGVVVIEVPYVKELFNKDTDVLRPGRLCYFSLTSLDRLLRQHALFIQRTRRLFAQNGSLMVFASTNYAQDADLEAALMQEAECGLASPGYYMAAAGRTKPTRGTKNAPFWPRQAQ